MEHMGPIYIYIYTQLTIDFFDELPAIGLTGLPTKKMALSVTLKIVGTSREYVTTQWIDALMAQSTIKIGDPCHWSDTCTHMDTWSFQYGGTTRIYTKWYKKTTERGLNVRDTNHPKDRVFSKHQATSASRHSLRGGGYTAKYWSLSDSLPQKLEAGLLDRIRSVFDGKHANSYP